MQIKLNRDCRTHTGHRFTKGEVISGPACVVDILLQLGFADIYTPAKTARKKKTKVTEESNGG